jgi:hypothetical protein
MSAFCTGVGGILAIGYALDSYHEIDGSVMTLVMCIRVGDQIKTQIARHGG